MAKSSIETSFQNLVNVIKDKTYPATSGAALEADIANIKIDITDLSISKIGISQIGISGGVAPTSHTHKTSDITNLDLTPYQLKDMVSAISISGTSFNKVESAIHALNDGKANSSHNHTVSDITDLDLTPYQLQQMASAVTIAGSSYTDVEPAIRALSENESDLKLDIDNLGISKISISQIGISGGVASLDANGKVPLSQLPPISGDSGLSIKDFQGVSIPGLYGVYGYNFWTDGDDIYYSYNNDQYVLNKTTGEWEAKTWTGLTYFDGRMIWTDGTDIYYSGYQDQYVLDKATSTWTPKTWNGFSNLDGRMIWKYDGAIYYSDSSNQYILDVATSTWIEKSAWTSWGLEGRFIWVFNDTVYSSNGTNQFILDVDNDTLTATTWNISYIDGDKIWTDGKSIYYTYDGNNYVLDEDNMEWDAISLSINPNGEYIWTDGEHTYYSYSDTYEFVDIPVMTVDVEGNITTIGDITDSSGNTMSNLKLDIDHLSISKIGISQIGIANGVAGLNSEGKLDFGDIDTDIISKADLEDMWDGEDLPILPLGYTMLSYIQNTDAQWINTGVSVTENTSADLIGLTPVEASRYGTFLGEGDRSGRIWSIRYKADSGVIQFQLGADNKAIDGPTLVNGSEYNIHAEIGKLVVNGTEYTGSEQSLGVPIATLRIFDNGSGERAHAKLFRCKIYESGVLIRDFIAAKRSTDNAIGMYDVVNNTFYGNDGNGDFTAGSPVGTRTSIGDSSTFKNLIDIVQLNMLPISRVGISGGVASLGNDGKVPSSQLPAMSIPVTSVNNKTGDVVLTPSDIGAVDKAGDTLTGDLNKVVYTNQTYTNYSILNAEGHHDVRLHSFANISGDVRWYMAPCSMGESPSDYRYEYNVYAFQNATEPFVLRFVDNNSGNTVYTLEIDPSDLPTATLADPLIVTIPSDVGSVTVYFSTVSTTKFATMNDIPEPTIINPVYVEFTVNSWTLVSGTYRSSFQISGLLNYALPHFLFIRPLSAAIETAAERAAFELITTSIIEADATPPTNSILTLFANTEPTTAFKVGIIAWKTE